ncbi:MAG: MBOAT family O-acyltransferase [Elainellaceae cyanobacterium]
MLFNSFIFVGFFVVIYSLYLALQKKHRAQNWLLLLASYGFYGYWDIRFLLLLMLSTGIDYIAGKNIDSARGERSRRIWVSVSLCANLSILGFFKYCNFFIESFASLVEKIGFDGNISSLSIILPVGISFYTFQTLSYTLDIYRRQLKPVSSLLDFALFVSFFPQLVAGPIERASTLLPQITSPRTLNISQINAGIYLILWGYFKKLVIADNVAGLADEVFEDYLDLGGLDLWIGALAFAIQIYGDFSGYSDIARGISKLLGFDLIVNFKLPFFARNPSDFWARWHISLSTWFRDYVYIPLGGNRHGTWNTYCNLMVTMTICGLWHGAAWNFVLWGMFHGFLLIAHHAVRHSWTLNHWNSIWKELNFRLSGLLGLFSVLLTMSLTTAGWIFFRASSVSQIIYMLSHLGLSISEETWDLFSDLLFFSFPLLAMQLYQGITQDLLAVTKLNLGVRTLLYGLMLAWIVLFSDRDSAEFIYFQF